MKKVNKLTAGILGAAIGTIGTGHAIAQEESISFEEIIVTGRKREESLTDVPISISVLGEDFIRDAGIVDQRDLFELTPGIFYDEQIDRLSQSPSVRGVQSSEIATNRTNVTSFIDGMPVLGAPASIAIGSTRQVEIYRGPQSAAFGRSTFGGAINYISPDPTEEFEGQLQLDVNDYGRQIFNGQISGPLSDNIGFLISAEIEDSDAPSEFESPEGVQYGARSGDSIGGKLVFNPTDALEIEFGYSTAKTEDGPQVAYFLTQEARDACFDGTVSVNMGTNVWTDGVFDCDWSQGADIVTQADRTTNLAAYYADPANAAELADITAITYTDANGDLANYTLDDLLYLAEIYSVPLDRFGAFDERERTTLQIDYTFENGSALQFSAFTGEEEYIREYETSRSIDGIIQIAPTAVGMGAAATLAAPLVINTMGTEVNAHMADPTEIDEDYAEIRWVSPGDDRLRWVAGASYYKTLFFTRLYTGGYTAVVDGTVDRADALLGLSGADSIGVANPVLGEESENTGLFANLTYDITDAFTVTAEARYQVDDVYAEDLETGQFLEEKTEALLPRLSFNYNPGGNNSFYGQISKGNNPAGINATMLGVDYQNTLNNGIANGLGGATSAQYDNDELVGLTCDGEAAAILNSDCNSIYVDYDADDISTFKEEELTQIEFGTKGTALDGRLSYSAAIYHIDWENEAQTVNISWDDPTIAMGGADFTTSRGAVNNGDKRTRGIEFEGTMNFTDSFSLRSTLSINESHYKNYCDIVNVDNTGLIAASGAQLGDHPVYGECVILSGNEVSQQPGLSGSLSPSYTTQLAGMRLNLRGDIRYQGVQYLDSLNVGELPATTTLNVSASLRSDDWTVALYVNNLADDDTPSRINGGNDYSLLDSNGDPLVFSQAFDDAGVDPERNILITPSTPRTIGLRVDYNF